MLVFPFPELGLNNQKFFACQKLRRRPLPIGPNAIAFISRQPGDGAGKTARVKALGEADDFLLVAKIAARRPLAKPITGGWVELDDLVDLRHRLHHRE